MVKITFVQPDGDEAVVEAATGRTIMEAATRNGVEGILAECGGNCTCGTCRIHPDEAWRDRLGPVSEIERDMLEYCGELESGVRLSCRIAVTEALDGLRVRVPESQY